MKVGASGTAKSTGSREEVRLSGRSSAWTARGDHQLAQNSSQLEEEIESWKGFPWALRKEDRKPWDAMIKEIREGYAEAIEHSEKEFTTEPFFMALLLAQQKTIKRLKGQLKALGVEAPTSSEIVEQTTLDG